MPAELAALVAKMMAKDRARRFQSPGEVAQALMPFFMKGAQAFQSPKPDVSLGGEAGAGPRMASTLSLPAQPEAGAERPAIGSEQAAKPDAAETRWDTLIAIRDAENSPDATPSVAPRRRPPLARLAFAASVLALTLAAAWLGAALDDTSPGNVTVAQIMRNNSTRNPRSPKGGSSSPRERGSKPLPPRPGTDQQNGSAGAASNNDLAGSVDGSAEGEMEARRDTRKPRPVAEADTARGAGGVDQKAEPTDPAGGPRLPESITLDLELPFMELGSAGTRAAPSAIRLDRMQLKTPESKLEDAKKRYEQARSQCNKELLIAFEGAIHNVDSNGTISAVNRQILKDELRKEKAEFLKDHRALPERETMLKPVIDYLFAMVAARAIGPGLRGAGGGVRTNRRPQGHEACSRSQ